MQNRTKFFGTAIAAAALAGAAFAAPAAAADRHHTMRGHHAMHGRMMHHRMSEGQMMRRSEIQNAPRYETGDAGPAVQYREGYQPGYTDNGFNPVTGVLGAAATIATAPLAIVTGGNPYGGYYGEPAYSAPYASGYGYNESPGWPKRGPYYNTW
jgi:hypothetical protein